MLIDIFIFSLIGSDWLGFYSKHCIPVPSPTYDVPADPEDLAVVSVRSGELVEAVVRGGCSAGVGG